MKIPSFKFPPSYRFDDPNKKGQQIPPLSGHPPPKKESDPQDLDPHSSLRWPGHHKYSNGSWI